MNDIKVPSEGPRNAKVMVIGEAPGQNETQQRRPFVGASGLELTKMLHEAGIPRSECYITNVCKYQPPYNQINRWIDARKTPPPGFVRHPDLGNWIHPKVLEGILELEQEIREVKPNLCIALGNTPLWATTGLDGITKWRGSLLPGRVSLGIPLKVLPTYHPTAIFRQWSWRFIAVHDLRRAAQERFSPELPPRLERYIIRPDYPTAVEKLQSLLATADREGLCLGTDIETRNRQIACIALAWSEVDAICLPFLSHQTESGSYWLTTEEETEIVFLLRQLLTHPRVKVVWQNGLYDLQYISRYWGFIPTYSADTMLLQHTMFSVLPKSLDFISSLHCKNHVYWKDDGKKYDPGKDPEEKHWSYNCRDAVVTVEAEKSLSQGLAKMNFKRTKYGTPQEIQHRMAMHCLRAMLRGVRWNYKLAGEYLFSLSEARLKREQFINTAVGQQLNTNSPKQLQKLFYEEMGLKPIINRKTKTPTTDAAALEELASRDPILKPLCTLINEVRQIRTALGFVGKSVDADGRIRCSYNVAGTETYRFSSSEDAFDFGTNLQNVTAGDENNPILPMPNMRKLFLPDEGNTWTDWDLPQADARVVAWDADDRELMEIFQDPKADLHTENAKAIFGYCPSKDHPNRQLAKKGVHAVNYLVSAPELARHLGVTVHEADRFIKQWFGAHPKIAEWHNRIRYEVQTRRYVENIYGYRRYVFERIDEKLIKELVAWIPQSTTAITINLGIDAVCSDEDLCRRGVEFLLQVHDSADFQLPTRDEAVLIPRIAERLTIEVPYETPLIMPPGCKKSTISWGHCE